MDRKRGADEDLTGSDPPFGCEKVEVCEGIGEPEKNGILRRDKRWLELECHKMSKDPNVWSTGREEEGSSRMPFVRQMGGKAGRTQDKE